MNLEIRINKIRDFQKLSNEELGLLFRQILNYIALCQNDLNFNPSPKYLEAQLPSNLQHLFNIMSIDIRKQLNLLRTSEKQEFMISDNLLQKYKQIVIETNDLLDRVK